MRCYDCFGCAKPCGREEMSSEEEQELIHLIKNIPTGTGNPVYKFTRSTLERLRNG